jgi:hypothetical protein
MALDLSDLYLVSYFVYCQFLRAVQGPDQVNSRFISVMEW